MVIPEYRIKSIESLKSVTKKKPKSQNRNCKNAPKSVSLWVL